MKTDDTGHAGDAFPSVKLLRLFDLLYSTRSVTRTAEQLGQSQPTVSNLLGQLRGLLGDELFVRTSTGMQPTPRADELIVMAREALASMRRLYTPAEEFDAATACRRFRICMTDASHIMLLPHLLAHIRTVAPGVRLEAMQMSDDSAHALQSGHADLAIGLAPWLDAGFYQQALYWQDWVCLASADHPRLTRKSLSLREYKAEAHIGIAGGTGAWLLQGALQRHQIERHVILELPGFLGLAAIVSTSDLVATVPRRIAEVLALTADMKVFDCPVPVPPFTVHQHWHARYHQDAGNRWLRGICESLFAQQNIKPVSRRSR